MKKIIKFFFLIISILMMINYVEAENNIKDFYCVYDVYNPYLRNVSITDPDKDKTPDKIFTKIKILVEDYNNGNGNFTLKTYFLNNGSWNESFSAQSGQTSIVIFEENREKEKKTFVDNYKTGGRCPRIYANQYMNGIERIMVDNYNRDEDKGTYFVLTTASEEKLRSTSSESDWKTPEEFFNTQSDPTTSPNQPEHGQEKVCSYEFNFDDKVYNNLHISFTKRKNIQNGNSVYEVKLDNEGQMQLVDLNDMNDITIYAEQANILLRKDILKKIYESEDCIEKDKICSYWSEATSKWTFTISLDFDECKNNTLSGEYSNGSGEKSNGKKPDTPNLGFNTNPMTCTEILGPNLTKIVHAGVKAIQIIGAIAAIVKGMITLIPAVMAKDAEGLKKAQKTLVTMAIILLCIFLLPYLVRWIGNILGYDISCLV